MRRSRGEADPGTTASIGPDIVGPVKPAKFAGVKKVAAVLNKPRATFQKNAAKMKTRRGGY